MAEIERLSIELSRRCEKACPFCYSHSGPTATGGWAIDAVVRLVTDCAGRGLRAVSFGGGEPLEFEGLFDLLTALDGLLFRSITTSGLRLASAWGPLLSARPDKVHVSLHAPDREAEVRRVIEQVVALDAAGVRSGVNLLVRRSGLPAATAAARALAAAGIGPERVVYLPMRGGDTPSPAELAAVAGGARFQSMTCLMGCGPSARFASLDAEGRAAWCSYTETRRALPSLDHAGLSAALDGLGLRPCG